jgi:membrane-bound metal-dependent hydrolase YbcI (DUF457 family)
LHRGLTHSLLALPVVGACAAGCGVLLFGTPFWPTFAITALAALSHLLLDSTVHTTGIQWFWPWRRRFRVPLLLGLNPLTSSARCAERSLLVCLRCSMHSAVLSPVVLLMWSGFLVSVAVPFWAISSQLTLAAAAFYVGFCWVMRLRAQKLVPAAGVFPAGFSPFRWLGVSRSDDGGFSVRAIEPVSGQVTELHNYGPSEQGSDVERSQNTETVSQLLETAVFPHVSRSGSILVWRDLAYAFSPSVSLFAARVVLDGERVTHEEFRERWDHLPEEREG